MDSQVIDTIDKHGDPLAFLLRQGHGRPPLFGGGRDVIKVEARQMAGHQKEAVVTEGADGTARRLTSDERNSILPAILPRSFVLSFLFLLAASPMASPA